MVPVSGRDPSKFQHQGFGLLLMEEAERIAREEHGSHKITVISGQVVDFCLPGDIFYETPGFEATIVHVHGWVPSHFVLSW